MFQIGDIVTPIQPIDNRLMPGQEGRVVYFPYDGRLGVQWSGLTRGHDLNSRLSPSDRSGWNVDAIAVLLVSAREPEPLNEWWNNP
jgi:hypothetical protein